MTRGDFESIIDEVSAIRCKEVIEKMMPDLEEKRLFVENAINLYMPLDLLSIAKGVVKK